MSLFRRGRLVCALLLCALSAPPAATAGSPQVKVEDPTVERLYTIDIVSPREVSPAELKAARRLLAERMPHLHVVSDPSLPPVPPAVLVVAPPRSQVSLPTAAELQVYGVGFEDEAERQRAARFGGTLTLVFVTGHDAGHLIYSRAQAVAAELAESLGGWIWDMHCRQLFTRDAWKKRRVHAPVEGLDVQGHIALHLYRADAGLRLVTLGMRKFGQPDLVINDVAPTVGRELGELVYLAAQHLIERREPTQGSWQLAIDAVRAQAARERLAGKRAAGAPGKVALHTAWATPEEGDPSNVLMELRFETGSGSPHAAQRAAVRALFGE